VRDVTIRVRRIDAHRWPRNPALWFLIVFLSLSGSLAERSAAATKTSSVSTITLTTSDVYLVVPDRPCVVPIWTIEDGAPWQTIVTLASPSALFAPVQTAGDNGILSIGGSPGKDATQVLCTIQVAPSRRECKVHLTVLSEKAPGKALQDLTLISDSGKALPVRLLFVEKGTDRVAVKAKSVAAMDATTAMQKSAGLIGKWKTWISQNREEEHDKYNRIHLLFDERGNRKDDDLEPGPGVEPPGDRRDRYLPFPVDENDRVIVHIVGIKSFIPRADANAPTVEPYVRVEGDLNANGPSSSAAAGEGVKPELAQMYTYAFGPFNKTVEISLSVPKDPYTSNTATFETVKIPTLPVYPLTHFEAKFALLHSSLTDRSFRKTNGRIDRIDNDTAIEPVFAVVPFVHGWSGRILQFEPRTFWERINPMLGVGLDTPGKSYFVGGALTIGRGVDVVAGVNLKRASRLNPGFSVGTPIAGDQVPASLDWQTEPFVGITFPSDVFQRVFRGHVGP